MIRQLGIELQRKQESGERGEEEILVRVAPWHQMTEGLCEKIFPYFREQGRPWCPSCLTGQGWNSMSKGKERRGRMEVGSDHHITSNVLWVLSRSLLLGISWVGRTVVVSGLQCDLVPSPEGKDTEEAM